MPYVITQACIGTQDKSCVDVCPVDCILEVSNMNVIDPTECIDCGACEPACPVDAIFPEELMPEAFSEFVEINAAIRHGVEAVNAALEARG
jgi:ferredoxin